MSVINIAGKVKIIKMHQLKKGGNKHNKIRLETTGTSIKYVLSRNVLKEKWWYGLPKIWIPMH